MIKNKKKKTLMEEFEQLRKKLRKYSSKLDSTQFIRKMRDNRRK